MYSCDLCGARLRSDDPGGLAKHQSGQSCQLRQRATRLKRRRVEQALFHSGLNESGFVVELDTETHLHHESQERDLMSVIGNAQQRLRSRDAFLRWILHRSDSEEGTVDITHPELDANREEGDEKLGENDGEPPKSNVFDRAEFLRSLRVKFAMTLDDPDGRRLPASARRRVLDMIDFTFQSLGAPFGIQNGDLFGPKGLNEYETRMKGSLDGDTWTEEVVTSPNGWFQCCVTYESDIEGSLCKIIRENFDHLRLRSAYNGHSFEHPVTGNFMRAHEQRIKLQRKTIGDWRGEERDIVLLISLYSDGTQLANKNSVSAHPLLMGIANLSVERYRSTLSYLAFLNVCMAEIDPCKKKLKMVPRDKAGLLATQLSIVTKKLKELSFTGFEMSIKGECYRFFPALFDTPIDNPEMTHVLGLLTNRCGECEWPPPKPKKLKTMEKKEERNPPGRSPPPFDPDGFPRRSEVRARAAASVDSSESYNYIHCGLWGFNGSCPRSSIPKSLKYHAELSRAGCWGRETDLYRAVSTERLHNLDSGGTKSMKEMIFIHLSHVDRWNNSRIEELNNALESCLLIESRWPGMRFPPRKREVGASLTGYIGGCTMIEATEHRTVLQILVPVLTRFLGSKHTLVKFASVYAKYYLTRERRLVHPRVHTLESLKETERLGKIVYDRLVSHKPLWGFRRPKVHVLMHFTQSVMREGFSDITTGDMHEGTHKKLKSYYRLDGTNRQKRTVSRQICRLIRRSILVGDLQKAEDERQTEQFSQRNNPGLPRPGQGKKRVVAVAARELDMCCLHKPKTGMKAGARFELSLLREWVALSRGEQRTWPSIPIPVELLIRQFGAWETAAALLEEISQSLYEVGSIDLVIRKYPRASVLVTHAGAIPCVPVDEDRASSRRRYLARCRCDRKFGESSSKTTGEVVDPGKPWIDSVAVADSSDHNGERVWYGRIALMFYLNVFDEDSSIGLQRKDWMPYLLLRCLDRVESAQDERLRFQSDEEPLITRLSYVIRPHLKRRIQTHSSVKTLLPILPSDAVAPNSGPSTWWFELVSPEMILRKIHLVAGNSEASMSLQSSNGELENVYVDCNSEFFINHYIWERDGLDDYYVSDDSCFRPFNE